MYNFKSYEEIPATITNYILTVANVHNIGQIPLHEINNFLNGLDEFEKGKMKNG